MSLSCSASDIQAINQTKEYTLTATYLLETVIKDTSLNAQAQKLWQLLFTRARFHENLEVTLSHKELALELNRSTRTIARYVQVLCDTGYLLVKPNFNDGGQGVTCNIIWHVLRDIKWRFYSGIGSSGLSGKDILSKSKPAAFDSKRCPSSI